jgi:hypothetical protein
MMWENTSSFGDDDLEYMQEENLKKRLQWFQKGVHGVGPKMLF